MNLPGARSIRQKLNFILTATSVLALLLAGVALVAFDLRSHLQAMETDLITQADIMALVSGPALTFDDPKVASENLSVLRAKPNVAAAALFDASGALFASFHAEDIPAQSVPHVAQAPGVSFDSEWIRVWRPVQSNRERVGMVFLQARHQLITRVFDYLGVLIVILTSSLAAALLMSNRLQGMLTRPILDISDVARRIRQGPDFRLRARKTSEDEIGDLVDVFNAMLDELERRAHTLEEANKAKDEFIATLAHELRNPLAPIRTGLDILGRDPGLSPLSRRTREAMERQLAHMIRLIDDLLDISRINSGKIRLEIARVRLSSVIESAVEISRSAIDAREHELTVEPPQHEVELMADATRLAQAVGNLLNNAAKYTPPHGHIRLRAWQEEGTAVIEVSDDGVGIPKDMLESVFSLFTQVSRTLDRSQGGLGIGLYLVQSLVELHGGTVSAASEGPGRGSGFTIRMPCLLQPAAGDSPAAHSADATAAAAGVKVLVVDDNVDAAEMLSMLLDMTGRQARAVHDGLAVLPAAEEFDPDVVLLDIGLPGMSGYDVARQLRANPRFSRTLLVALTGWGGQEDRRRSKEAGFDDHLTKPVDLAALEQLLGRLGH